MSGSHSAQTVPRLVNDDRACATVKQFDSRRRPQLLVFALGCVLSILGNVGAPFSAWADEPKIDFNRQIRPILSDKCFRCHGPDSSQRQAGLRLDRPDIATHELDSGTTAIIPSDPDHSELVRRIYSDDESERMPPPTSQKSLSGEEKTLLKAWIAEGAHYMPHWSLIPPKHCEVPQIPDDHWSRNEIDHFILQRLQQEHLSPSPEADRRTLIRRVSFDLTGLPPSIAEVDSFVHDDGPNAYERLVDRLLASPRYGERMAVPWLDLARYADSDGYEKDGHRQMWPFRDWVINAFNTNMPFDQFTIEQLAGDLLPQATRDQKLASAFNRNNPTTSEGGADPDEYAAKYAIDRVTTTTNVWFGLTMQCAECHDHKFDPLTNEDFYRMFAFFNQVPEIPLYEGPDAPPSMPYPTPEQSSALAEVSGQVVTAKSKFEAAVDRLMNEQSRWEDAQRHADTSTFGEPEEGRLAQYSPDERQLDKSHDSTNPNDSGQVVATAAGDSPPQKSAGPVGGAWKFDGKGLLKCESSFSIETRKGLSYGGWVRPTQQGGVVLSKIDPSQASRGFDLFMQEGQAIVHVIDTWPTATLKVKSASKYVADQWVHVLVTWDGGDKKESIHIYFNGQLQPLAADIEAPPIGSVENAAPLRIGGRANNESAMHGEIGDICVYNRPLAAAEVLTLVGHTVRQLLETQALSRTADQSRIVSDYYRQTAVTADTATLRDELAASEKKQHELDAAIPKVRVMQQVPERRPTHVLVRGDYRNPGKEVTAAIPAVFGSLPESAPSDRLALARWIVGPDDPLTARVTVNRLWALCFGTGIVATANDFGSQGELPSHPELLDWLATEFIARGWDIKAMLRLMVTSSAYRQSSRITPELAEHDPQNRVLARGPRQRLPAEMIRDNALAVAGLLQEQVGGPSVHPYHPAGLWEEMAWSESPWKTWPQDHGNDLYRRGLYTFWKRSVLHPVLSLFDAPSRNVCAVDRSLTNTPLQAFVTLNEDSFVEAARGLAAKMMTKQAGSPEESIDFGFMSATARAPEPREREVLLAAYQRLRAHFAEQPQAAAALLAVGDSRQPAGLDPVDEAAWTGVAQIILNLDEAITKE
jgi:hypothetical protein